MNITAIIFGAILLTAGAAGINYVTMPGLDVMFGAANGEDVSAGQVLATGFILWISTGFFVILCLGGAFISFLGFIATKKPTYRF